MANIYLNIFSHYKSLLFPVVSSNNCTRSGRLGAFKSENVKAVCMHIDTEVAESPLHEVSNVAA